MKRYTFLIVSFLGFLFLAPLSLMAETWPDRDFRVFMETPGGKKYPNAITASVANNIESWLKRVAKEYEAMGYKAPLWDHVDDNSFYSKKGYMVYVYPDTSPDAAHAAMLNPCAISTNNFTGKSQWIKISTYMTFNSAIGIKNGKLTTKAYQDLAHELFHAVQNSYALFTGNCQTPPGAWLIEGTAEAVGIEMARKLRGKRPEGVCQMGLRRYNRELYVREPKIIKDQCGNRSYLTQSFWQFLGEYAHRKFMGDYAEKGYIATEEFVPPDFRFLHNFFSKTHNMGSPLKEYVWLDKVLRQNNRYGRHQFGMSLQTAYSRFVGTFALYWKYERQKLYPTNSPLQSSSISNLNSNLNQEPNWMKLIYDSCFEVSVTKDATPQPVTLPMRRVAARCLKVNFNFTGRVGLTFYASGLSKATELESLAISTNGGKKIIRRHPAEQVADRIGKFPKISAKAGVPQYFIVSNVAKKANTTVAIDPMISIVPEIATTDMAKEKKEPEDSDPSEKQERENARKSRSWNGQLRQNKKRECIKPFEASPCGPTTRLDLLLVPDTAHLLDSLKEPSMSWERKFRLFDDVVQEGGNSFVSDYVNDMNEIQQQDGWEVGIVIPQIQPGFTGTISNAHIQVAKAIPQRGSYRALGPWVGSCSDGYYPATGQVMIEEFSKYVMRGTFSADLVDSETLKSCQSAAIVESDGGSFSITEIDWNLDIDTPPPSDDAIIDRTIEDANEVLPGLITDDMREHIKERAKKEREKQKQLKQQKEEAATKKKVSVFEKCGCKCEMEANFCASNPTAECCVSCEPIFNVCKGNIKSHSAELTAEEQAQEDTEVHAMRQQYEAYIESHGMSGDMKLQMMKAFDDIKTIDEKRMLMMSLPLK